MKRSKRNRPGGRINIGQTREVQVENEIQRNVLAADMIIFQDNPQLISYIRIYVPGEFPDDFIADKRLAYKWTLVTKKSGIITRSPMTQEQYLLVNPQNDFPENSNPGDVMVLPLEMKSS